MFKKGEQRGETHILGGCQIHQPQRNRRNPPRLDEKAQAPRRASSKLTLFEKGKKEKKLKGAGRSKKS